MFNKVLYSRYIHIKERCYNTRHPNYQNYGKRGIKMCDEWFNNYHAFERWALSHGFKKELQIDRINNNGDYSPDNCRFVSIKENSQNRRNSRWITIDGETKNVQQWCDIYGISRGAFDARIKKGMSEEEALKTPVKSHTRDKTRLVGRKYGRLTVIKYAGDEYIYNGNSAWICQCDCGNTKIINEGDLLKGSTSSCGCLRRELSAKRLRENPIAKGKKRK